MVSKLRTHNRFSFSVRMKRSATPLPSRFPHETRRALDAEERDLLLKVVGQIVRPVVVPEPEPAGHAVADLTEAFADALADRLQGLKSGPALGRMQADALGCAVIDGHEDEGRALTHGHRGRHVRAPHHIGGLGGDGPVVRLRAVRVAHAVRGLEVVLPHQPAHPLLGRADSHDPQLRPGFPVPFAMKRRRLEHAANMADQDVVRGGADRPAPARGRRRLPPRIHAGAGAVPHAADPLHAVRPTAWRSSGRPSSPRPPPGQRAGRLQLVHLRVEQFVLHQ